MVRQKEVLPEVAEITKEIIAILQKRDGLLVVEIARKSKRPVNAVYPNIKTMEEEGLVKTQKIGTGKKVFLTENNKEKNEDVVFLKILKGFGLTNIDMKILQAEGENSIDIAKQAGMSVNIVEQYKTNIFVRLEVNTLEEARRKLIAVKQKS